MNLIGAEVMGSMSPYGVGGGHRHTPEIEQGLSKALNAPVTVSFTPTLAPMSRGILTTATAKVRPGVTAEELRRAGARPTTRSRSCTCCRNASGPPQVRPGLQPCRDAAGP